MITAISNCTILSSRDFSFPTLNLKFAVALKQIKPYGKIVYEYNPLHNLRLPDGTLTDFDTSELNFDLSHPISIHTQYSYDGSVNLILNDNKNEPRLINTRFTTLEGNTYKIVDRIGNNDTNIYDSGEQFSTDVSLYKKVTSIPSINFKGVKTGGNMKVGNYVFYFKYSDVDGNETDFVGESSIVSLHVGNLKDPSTIRGGSLDENSYKIVHFNLSNVDASYDYINVYFTRSTSELTSEITSAFKIDKKFIIKNNSANILITGNEKFEEVSLADINIQFNLVDAVKSHTECQNRLFLANIKSPEIPYSELSDLALRFYPFVTTKSIGAVNQAYKDETGLYEYYNTDNIYNSLSYWNKEMYRLAVVFILPNNSLSPPFNIRGRDGLSTFNVGDSISTYYKDIPVYDSNNSRVYINVNDNDYSISTNTTISEVSNQSQLENAKGVIKINYSGNNSTYEALGVKIVANPEVITEIKKYAKGFFFVRQKRIPTILCQGLTIGLDRTSYLPSVPIGRASVQNIKKSTQGSKARVKYLTEVLNKNSDRYYMLERFIDDDRNITHSFEDRLYFETPSEILHKGLICPEAFVNNAYFSQIFTGGEMVVTESLWQPKVNYFKTNGINNRNLYIDEYKVNSNNSLYPTKLTLVADGMKTISDGTQTYSARAGDSEEVKFSYIYRENKVKNASNLIRGLYGSYVGINGYSEEMKIVDIHIPGYDSSKIKDYFEIRYNDKSSYYAISDRIDIQDISSVNMDCYRGDCFICNYTQRINRNFQDIEAPNNDLIIDETTWKDNYDINDSVATNKINRGDVNAVQLGHWVTFKVCSNYNLSFRDIDKQYASEEALTGVPRNFYPLFAQSVSGNFKIPESQIINTGFNSTTSDRYNFELPNVPYLKNDYQTRILYSNINISDAFKNGFRTYELMDFMDYPKTYGSITKIIEVFGNLLCIFEHGITLIPVNERTLSGSGDGGNVFINTSNVLPENPKVLSDMYGSQWAESVIKTPYYIYGIDTVAKKIWRTNGSTFDVISEFKIQNFLNNNISLTERELSPIIGVRNVKTHYNAYKGDVMFTFYDNLYGFEEKVWNICFNEKQQKWITFYSWLPSYSENIDNIYFSFDRNTSKWISKLGLCSKDSNSADGIVLDNPIFSSTNIKTKLSLVNRELPNSFGTKLPDINYVYSLERDNFGNYKKFQVTNENGTYYLNFTGTIEELNSKTAWQLNLKVDITINEYTGTDNNIKQYIDRWNNYTSTNYGFYQNSVVVISDTVLNNNSDSTKPHLFTDFWKHGKAGIIDIADRILPTKWYGKQHPFEFEVVVSETPIAQKVFENLKIISNKAEPESFHFEIVGENLDIAEDKLNTYFRQEATKSVYQYNGSDILYNKEYLKLTPTQRDINNSLYKDRSTMFPLYYSRVDSFNEIEDYYQMATSAGKDYQNLSGSEIVINGNNEFGICTHIRGNDINKAGRLRGNMLYMGDIWQIQIPSIVYNQKNELAWPISYPPINLVNSPIPSDLPTLTLNSDADVPEELRNLGYKADLNSFDLQKWTLRKETKIRDKYCKIKVRYSGSNLAIIHALLTTYSISYV